ncbi:MAG: hypothetical protein ACLVCH_13125 [Roseburia inulinivorans]
MIRDVCAACIVGDREWKGVFYWEGTWIPVGSADADNSAFCGRKYSEAAGQVRIIRLKYDPDDAGLCYGGLFLGQSGSNV